MDGLQGPALPGILCLLKHLLPTLWLQPSLCRLIESAKLLLKSGADPFIPDAHGSLPVRYALQYAGRLGQTELAEVLFAAMYDEHANLKVSISSWLYTNVWA